MLEGLRFDISALLYINLPFCALLIFHFFWAKSNSFKRLINIIFYSINIPFILLNNIDIAFYAFNLKRSTIDLFSFITYADFKNVYSSYVIDYWPLSLLSVFQIVILLSFKYLPNVSKRSPFALITLLVSVTLVIYGMRGGTQLKPIKPIHAGTLSHSDHTDLILNTPFSMLHSYNQQTIPPLSYFDSIDTTLYSPIHSAHPSTFQKDNVVIIILESFSKEFVGYHNNGNGYTPFLDSLMSTGLVLENAYANGLRSIEALPAITASLPSLFEEPLITSSYANNSFSSIAKLLNNEGYKTSFFHGGERGTMGFYEFSKKADFETYYGKEEYNNSADDDNSWGIYDEPFFQFFAQTLNQTKEPFLSVLFSLTSHPPYKIPDAYLNTFDKGELLIHESIGYSDMALKEFFMTAQQMDWFENTLFVITADHTSGLSHESDYKNKIGRYSIPLVFWKADGSLNGSIDRISQQIDIVPSIMDLLSYDKDFFSFGKSVFDKESWSVAFLKGQYLLINDEGFLTNTKENYITYRDKALKEAVETSDSMIQLLQSIKQEFNNRMLRNQIRINEN